MPLRKTYQIMSLLVDNIKKPKLLLGVCVLLMSILPVFASEDICQTSNCFSNNDTVFFLTQYQICNKELECFFIESMENFSSFKSTTNDDCGYIFDLRIGLKIEDSNIHFTLSSFYEQEAYNVMFLYLFDKSDTKDTLAGYVEVKGFNVIIKKNSAICEEEFEPLFRETGNKKKFIVENKSPVIDTSCMGRYYKWRFNLPLKNKNNYNPPFKPVLLAQKKIYSCLWILSNIYFQKTYWPNPQAYSYNYSKCDSSNTSGCKRLMCVLYEELYFDSFVTDRIVEYDGKKYQTESLNENVFVELIKLDSMLNEYRDSIEKNEMTDEEIVKDSYWNCIVRQAGTALRLWNESVGNK